MQNGGETENLILRLGLTKNITFIHGVSSEDLVKHYATASIAVVPSIYEGFGLPAAEAMACGLPVISTNGGALPEVVGKAGLIVPVKDEDAIADRIEKLLKDKSLRDNLSQAARQRIEKNFSWDAAAKQISILYYKII